jgi:hypothetical protein
MRERSIAATVAALAFLSANIFAAEQGDDNPTGVSGIYNGSVDSGGSYDPYNGNARRTVDDLTVPGALGAYPLKWSRTFNSHATYGATSTGGKWSFSYIGYRFDPVRNIIFTPSGGGLDFLNAQDERIFGVPEFVETEYPYQERTLRMGDGGKVVFLVSNGNKASKIIDPYGMETTIVESGTGSGKTTKIT